MNRPGDAYIAISVDATLPIGFTLNDDDGDPIDITGYAARSSFLVYDGTQYGIELYAPAVTVGTTDGLFSVELTPTELAALLAACPSGEPARFRVFATPPAASEFEMAHGSLQIRLPGAFVPVTDVTIERDDYSVDVHCLGAAGPPGEDGPPGPAASVTFAAVQTALGAASSTIGVNGQQVTSSAGPSGGTSFTNRDYVDAAATATGTAAAAYALSLVTALTANTPGAADTVFVTNSAGNGLVWVTIVNANVSAAAAIAGTKISPDFGAQNVVTTGGIHQGATLPTTGSMRVAAPWSLYSRDVGGGATNYRLLGFSQSGNNGVYIGDSVDTTTTICGGVINFNVGGPTPNGTGRASLSTTRFTLTLGEMHFNPSGSLNALIDLESNGSGAGGTLRLVAGASSNAGSAGGIVAVSGGAGGAGGAGGGVRLQRNGTTVVEVGESGGASTLAFYGGTPVAQAARAGQLTDSSTGVAAATIVDVGGVPTQANCNNNFASLTQRINALETIIHNLELSA